MTSLRDRVEGAVEKSEELKSDLHDADVLKQLLENQILILRLLSPKQKAKPKTQKERPRNLYWDAVCEIWKLNPKTQSELSRVGKIARDMKLKEINIEHIRTKISIYRKTYPGAACTPEALLKHWDFLRGAPKTPAEQRASDQTRQAHDLGLE